MAVSSPPAIARTGRSIVATVGMESGRVARPACTAIKASGVRVMRARHSETISGRRWRELSPINNFAMPSNSADTPDLARDNDVRGALDERRLGIGLRLGADKRQAAHAPGRLPPQLQHHVAANGATHEDRFPHGQMIEQRQHVRGELLHPEHRRIGNALECARWH